MPIRGATVCFVVSAGACGGGG